MAYEFRTCVDGIPCICRVTWYQPADNTPVNSTTISPPDEEEFHFELLDRNGKPANWLNRKITPEIEAEMLAQFKKKDGRNMNINDINMADLPDTVPFECYVHISPHTGVAASYLDMSCHGYIPLGKVTVDVPVPKDGNPVEMLLESLEAKANHIQEQCNLELNKIAEQKAQILALPWKGADDVEHDA